MLSLFFIPLSVCVKSVFPILKYSITIKLKRIKYLYSICCLPRHYIKGGDYSGQSDKALTYRCNFAGRLHRRYVRGIATTGSRKGRMAKAGQGCRIGSSAPITVVDQKEPNAWVTFSLNKYSITVTKGMLDLLDSEDELAGVLAHEIGHIKLNHYGRTVTRSVLWSLIFRAVGNSSSRIDP